MSRFRQWTLCCLVSLLFVTAVFEQTAYAWPLNPVYVQLWGPENKGDGAQWCARSFNGTYGSSFFFKSEVWVSYGGTCNAPWGRPAGYVGSQAQVFSCGSTLMASSYAENVFNTNSAQANVPYLSNACIYGGLAHIFNEVLGHPRLPVEGYFRWA